MEHQCMVLLLLCICAVGQGDASAEPTETPMNTEKGKSSTAHGKVGLKERAWMLFISDDGIFGPKKGADNSRPPEGAYALSSAPPRQVSDEAVQNSTSDEASRSGASVNANGSDSSQANATGSASQNSASRYTVIVSNQQNMASTASPSPGREGFYTVIVTNQKRKEANSSAALLNINAGEMSASEVQSNGSSSRTSVSPDRAGDPPFYTVIVAGSKHKESKASGSKHHNKGAVSASETLPNGSRFRTSLSPAGAGNPPYYTVIVTDQKKKGSKGSAAFYQHNQGSISTSSKTSLSPDGAGNPTFYTVIVTDPKRKESNSSAASEQTIQGAMSAFETFSNGSFSMTSLSPGGAGGPPFYTVIVTDTKGKESNASEQHFQGGTLPSETPSSGLTTGTGAGSSGGGLSHASNADFSSLGGSLKGVSIRPDMSPVINIINGMIAPHRGMGWSSAGSPGGHAVSSHEKSKKFSGKMLKSPAAEHGVHHHSHPAPGRQEHHSHISAIKAAYFGMLHGKEQQKKEKPPLLGSGSHEGSFRTPFSSSQSKATKLDIATGGASTTSATPTTVTSAPSKTPTTSTSGQKPVGGGYVQAVVAIVQNFKVDQGGIKN